MYHTLTVTRKHPSTFLVITTIIKPRTSKKTATTQVHPYLLPYHLLPLFTSYPTQLTFSPKHRAQISPSLSSPPSKKKKNSMKTKPLPHELPSRKGFLSSLYIKTTSSPSPSFPSPSGGLGWIGRDGGFHVLGANGTLND